MYALTFVSLPLLLGAADVEPFPVNPGFLGLFDIDRVRSRYIVYRIVWVHGLQIEQA